MKKRSWDGKTKAKIVLEGLSGMATGELCAKHQISQAQYYQWRDKLLVDAYRAFDGKDTSGEVRRLKDKNTQLQRIIGQLTVEFKKSEDEW